MGVTCRIALASAAALALLAPTSAAAATTAWNLRQADVPAAQRAGHDGAGVVVAIVDTWVDAGHPALSARSLAGADCVGGCRTPDRVPRDRCDHGTHVAGLVAAPQYGVAPGATLLPVRVLRYDRATRSCTGAARDVAAGVRWAVGHHARVVNLSVGTRHPALAARNPVVAAIRYAARRGVVVVVAAGNSAAPLGTGYRGDAIVVGATGPDRRLAGYSERGPEVDVAAPGGDTGGAPSCRPTTCVASTLPRGRRGLLEGTSMAAAEVSGIAALVLGARPDLSRRAVIRAIESTARPLAGVRYGAVDAAAAVGAVRPRRSVERNRTVQPNRPADAESAVGDGHRVTALTAIAVGVAAAAGAAALRITRDY